MTTVQQSGSGYRLADQKVPFLPVSVLLYHRTQKKLLALNDMSCCDDRRVKNHMESCRISTIVPGDSCIVQCWTHNSVLQGRSPVSIFQSREMIAIIFLFVCFHSEIWDHCFLSNTTISPPNGICLFGFSICVQCIIYCEECRQWQLLWKRFFWLGVMWHLQSSIGICKLLTMNRKSYFVF